MLRLRLVSLTGVILLLTGPFADAPLAFSERGSCGTLLCAIQAKVEANVSCTQSELDEWSALFKIWRYFAAVLRTTSTPLIVMSFDLPSYEEASGAPSYRSIQESPDLLGMPDTLLLSILSHCNFVTLQLALRPTCRRLNLFCLSLLRKAALPHFEEHLPPAYATASNPLHPGRRHEVKILDLMIAALANLSRLKFETNLHILAGDDVMQAYPELFEAMQPQACLQDLVEGACFLLMPILLCRHLIMDVELLTANPIKDLIPQDISLLFSKRRVTLQLPIRAASSSQLKVVTIRKKVFDLPRTFDETLEMTARRLAAQLVHWSIFRDEADGVRYYQWS